MQIDLRAHTALTEAERDALTALRAAVHPPETAATATRPERQIEWARVDWHLFVRDDTGAVVSHVGLIVREGTLDQQPVRIGGVGGVQTHPDARGAGYAGAAMARAAGWFVDAGVNFALLVCDPARLSFYEQFGWRGFGGSLIVRQWGERVVFTANEPMVLPVCDPAPDHGAIDLCGPPW